VGCFLRRNNHTIHTRFTSLQIIRETTIFVTFELKIQRCRLKTTFANFAAFILTLTPKQSVSSLLPLFTPNLTTVTLCTIIFQTVYCIGSNRFRTLLLVLSSWPINSIASLPFLNLSTDSTNVFNATLSLLSMNFSVV